MDDINKLIEFLHPEARMDLKSAACMTVAQLTGTFDGIKMLHSQSKLLTAVLQLVNDKEIYTGKDAMRIFVNISAEPLYAKSLMDIEGNFVEVIIQCIEDPEYIHADFACAVLANMTRPPELCEAVFNVIQELKAKMESLVNIFTNLVYNKKGAKLHLLSAFFSNISQTSSGRRLLMAKNRCLMEHLAPFINYSDSKGRRKSILAVVHNCCFEKEYHSWLLSDSVDIISRLLLPLAGPDTFTEEETNSLPLDLQYLPDDKQREPDHEIRIMVLESIMQLCSTLSSRAILREKYIYLILREHHKWEEHPQCVALNEDIVNLLIRTEEEIGAEDLRSVCVPSDMAKKFADFDALQQELK